MADTKKEKKVFFQRKQVKLALKALLAHLEVEAQKKKPADLYDTADGLWLLVTVAKIPKQRSKPIVLNLPHHVVGDKEVCLISSQPGKDVKKTFQEIGVDNVEKVISLTKLKKNYSTFALKRQLISSYDVFVCEDKLYPLVLKSLGKECYKRKKLPIPLKLKNNNWKEEIHRCVNSSVLRMGHGTCSALRLGNFGSLTEQELFENIVYAMVTVSKLLPGHEKNIKSVHLKSCNSIALPIFQADLTKTNEFMISRDAREVPAKKRRRKKKTKERTSGLEIESIAEKSTSENVETVETDTATVKKKKLEEVTDEKGDSVVLETPSTRRKSRKIVEVPKITPERKKGLRSYKAKTPATVVK